MTKELRNKLLSQALLALGQIAFPLVTYPVVTRALEARGLGKVNFADSIVQTVLIIASLGIPLYGIREIAIHRKRKNEQSAVFYELFLLQLLVCLPALILIWIIGTISHVDHLLIYTGMIAMAGAGLSADWYLQGNDRFFYIALRSFIIRAITAVLIILFIREEKDYILYYALLSLSVVLTMFLNLATISRSLKPFRGSLRPMQHLKKINWIYACYLFASFYTVTDTLMLGWLSSEEVVGHYSFAYRLVRMSAMLIPTLGIVFIPGISFYHAESDRENVKQQINSSQQLIFLLGIPLSLFFLVLAPEIVAAFASADFAPSVTIIRLLSPIPLLVSFSHLTGTQIMVSVKKEKQYFIFLLLGTILNVVSDLVFIPIWQGKAAAISNLATEAFVTVGTVIYLRKLKLLSFARQPVISVVFSSLVLLPVVYGCRQLQLSPLLILIISGTVAGLVYLLLQLKLSGKKLSTIISLEKPQ